MSDAEFIGGFFIGLFAASIVVGGVMLIDDQRSMIHATEKFDQSCLDNVQLSKCSRMGMVHGVRDDEMFSCRNDCNPHVAFLFSEEQLAECRT